METYDKHVGRGSFRENLQAEYDAIALYTRLAKAEPNAELAKVYQRLAETEARHAEVWAARPGFRLAAPWPLGGVNILNHFRA